MGLFDDIFGKGNRDDSPEVPQTERFPSDTYAPAYSVAVYHEDLVALRRLIEIETSTPTAVEQEPLLAEAMDDRVRKNSEEAVPVILEVLESWEEQMDCDPSSVWWPVSTDWQFESYLKHCEFRNEQEEDDFEFPEAIGRVHTLLKRCKAAQENDSKLAIVHKDYVPNEEPGDEELDLV